MRSGKLLKRNGGGDRTRTCISFRTAVFKTAALPLCDPSAGLAVEDYNAGNSMPQPCAAHRCSYLGEGVLIGTVALAR